MHFIDDVLHRHYIRDLTPGIPGPVTAPTPARLVPRAIGVSPADAASAASCRWSHSGLPRSSAPLTTPLQLLRAHKRHDNRVQEISEISRDLKMLAKELNVPVIALSQLNRAVEGRHPPVPMLSDLRECLTGDQIIYDAHTGLRTTVRAIAEGRTTFVHGLTAT